MTTSMNFHFRPSRCEGRSLGRLFIRVIRGRRSRDLSRPYRIYADEWDASRRRVLLSPSGCASDRRDCLSSIDDCMQRDLRRLQEIVSGLSSRDDFSVSEVVDRFGEWLNRDTVSGYAESVGHCLRASGRARTARAYRSAARSLRVFSGGREILLSEIDASLMGGYEHYLLGRGLKLNTVSFYLRNLRALYFRAVSERLIPRQAVNPFGGMHTGVYETRRRALNGDQLKALVALEGSLQERLERPESPPSSARRADGPAVGDSGSLTGSGASSAERRLRTGQLHDALLYFLFCYHARGMSFVDLAHLRWCDVGPESLSYRRRKTGGLLELKVTDPMKRILFHFAGRTQGSEYIFPVLDASGVGLWRQYETGLKRQNRWLKVLARMAGIGDSLSTHAARHTWATLAKRLHVPVAVIGEALGHRDVKTTSIYLASFDRATMDELSVRLSDAVRAA